MKKTLRDIRLCLFPFLTLQSVTRVGLNKELKRQFKKLKRGKVLDVGAAYAPYKETIPHTEYLTLDVDKTRHPDICSDLHKIKCKSSYFDTIIATEVLEHLHDPQKAIDEIHRILKPSGICILSTRFIFKYHADPKDYYRFTRDSLNHLCRKFKKTEIYHHGNWIQVMWQLLSDKLGVLSNVLSPLFAKIHFKKTDFPLGFIVYTRK